MKANFSISSNKTVDRCRRISAVISSMSVAFLLKDLVSYCVEDFTDLFQSLSLEGIDFDDNKDIFMDRFKKEFPDDSGRYVFSEIWEEFNAHNICFAVFKAFLSFVLSSLEFNPANNCIILNNMKMFNFLTWLTFSILNLIGNNCY